MVNSRHTLPHTHSTTPGLDADTGAGAAVGTLHAGVALLPPVVKPRANAAAVSGSVMPDSLTALSAAINDAMTGGVCVCQ